jgi:hypothetical protein
MAASHLEPLLHDLERRAVALALCSHPDWTLGEVLAYVGKGGPRSPILRELTLGELLELVEPAIDPSLLRRARQACGEQFDELVREVLAAAPGAVGASYLRARVGGPRWKLLATLHRLVEAGFVERSGATCATRYRFIEGNR